MNKDIYFITDIVPAQQTSLESRLTVSDGIIQLKSEDYSTVSEKILTLYDCYLAERQRINAWYQNQIDMLKPEIISKNGYSLFLVVHGWILGLGLGFSTLGLGTYMAVYFFGWGFQTGGALVFLGGIPGLLLEAFGIELGKETGIAHAKKYVLCKKEKQLNALNQKYIPLLMEAQK